MSKTLLLKTLSDLLIEQGRKYGEMIDPSTGKKVGDEIGSLDFTDMLNVTKRLSKKVYDDEDFLFSSTIGTLDTTPLEKELGNIFVVPTNKGGTYGWRNRICRSDLKDKQRYNYIHWHAGRDYSGIGRKWVITLKDGVITGKGSMCFNIDYTDGSYSRFCHMTDVVSSGKVFAGEIVGMIGDVGSAGHVHLHWEYYPNGGSSTKHTVPPLNTKYTQSNSCVNKNVNLPYYAYYLNGTRVKSIGEVMKVGGAPTEKENYDKVYLIRTDIDPNGYEENYIKYINSDITKEAYDDILKKYRNVLKVSIDDTDKKDEEEIKKDENLKNTYTELPPNIQKLIDKLKTDWGVSVTQSHIDKEYDMEGDVRPDAGAVDSQAEKKIMELIKDCKKANPNVTYPVDIKSGYRSYTDQVKNFGKKVRDEGRSIDNVQASNCLPGFSQHHTGKAFDIFSVETSWWNSNSDVKKWVANNCKKYGFEVTYTKTNELRVPEPWHLFYTGIDFEEEDDLDSEGLSDGKTVVFGGIGYATPEWMKSQWVAAGLSSDRAVFLSYTSGELSTVKENNNIDKIVGFSAGGSKVWDEIIYDSSDYKFIGLIDPSTSQFQFEKYKDGGLPSVVKSLSNYNNWNDYPNTKKRLKYLEDKNVLTKTNLNHKSIPLEFFKKYKTKLS